MSNATGSLAYAPYGQGGRNVHLPVDAASKVYKGALVSQLTATGMLVAGSTASSGPAVGVATHDADNTASGAADGDVRCVVHTDRVFLFANGTSTDACSEATLMGAPVYMHDDHTVYDNDASGTLMRAGYFAGMHPDGRVRVFVTAFGAAGAVASAPAALTYSAVAGTANDTLQACPDPTDTPATADALRDDIVATLLPPVRNNFADLAAKVNAIRTALINAGLMV
jgi:hypothetical protein